MAAAQFFKAIVQQYRERDDHPLPRTCPELAIFRPCRRTTSLSAAQHVGRWVHSGCGRAAQPRLGMIPECDKQEVGAIGIAA